MKLQNTSRNFAAFAALTIVGTALSTTPATAQVWQASADFSSVQGYRNWHYMTYLPDTDTYELMEYGLNAYGFNSWHTEPNNGDYITEWGMHPASDPESAKVWESPLAGTVHVTGLINAADIGGGNGVRVSIWKNETLLSENNLAYDDAVGYNLDLTVHVMPGDWLIFRVDALGDTTYDGTSCDPRITVLSIDGSSGGSWIADVLSDTSAYVADLELSLFEGQNDNGRSARRMSLSHDLKVASNRVSSGEINAALQSLGNAIWRLNGNSSTNPPDWMIESPEKAALRDDLATLHFILRGL